MSSSASDPAEPHPAWGDGWAVGLRVWVERAGQSILGPGRLELLEGIERLHSISAAARQMGMSYRRAWEMVQKINESAGQPLVVAATGGVQGGGASLTPLGSWTVAVFRQLQDQLRQTAAGLLPRLVQREGPPCLHVAAAVSLEEVLEQLLTDYALQEPTVRVRAVFGASDELADHLLAGAPGDLFLSADPRQLDRLELARLIEPGQRITLAENGLAAIGLASREPLVRQPADLARPDLSRIALATPDSPLGGYTRTYLESLNLYESLLVRAVQVDNSRAVISAVRAGLADVGLVYSSDATRAEGCRLLFRVRQTPGAIRYTGAVLSRAIDQAAVRQLVAFLHSGHARQRFRSCGFLPGRLMNPPSP